jgi:hypothetical protein
MKRRQLIALLILFGAAAAARAQYIRRDINGLDPGESRHMMEESQRQQRNEFRRQQEAWSRPPEWPQYNQTVYTPAPAPIAPAAVTADVASATPAEQIPPLTAAGTLTQPPPPMNVWAIAGASAVALALALGFWRWSSRRGRLRPGRASG